MGKLELFKEHRKRLGDIQLRALPTEFDSNKITVTEDREIRGYAIVWGQKNSHSEIVLKGATLNSLNARGVNSTRNKIQFLYQHNTTQPIAVITELEEDDFGLRFVAKIVDTQLGNEVIELINAGALRQLSYGFNYIWDKAEYDADEDAYILREIKLWEISLVTFSSDESAQLRAFNFATYQKLELLKELDIFALRNLLLLNNDQRDILKKEEENKRKVKFL